MVKQQVPPHPATRTRNAPHHRRGDLMLRALLVLEQAAYGIGDLLFVFSLPYGTPLGKALNALESRQSHRDTRAATAREKIFERQRLYNLLQRLRADDLIEKQENGRYRITGEGRGRLQKLRMRPALPPTTYRASPGNRLVVVAFDIPEHERRKRQWLRAALRNLKFTMLQKSLWVGTNKIPEELMHELGNLQLTQYVHVFAVDRPGSVPQKP